MSLNVERFRREIQLAARLQHPHIVPLLTAGESGGLPYFTMPFIQGESLRTRLTTAKAGVYYAGGQPDRARAYADSIIAIGLSPRFSGPIAWARSTILAQGYAILGQRAKSLEQVAAVEPYLAPQAQDDQFQWQMERAIAGTFALLGNADSTIAHLRTLLKMPSGLTLNSARIDVNFRRLQGDPVWDRFLAGQ